MGAGALGDFEILKGKFPKLYEHLQQGNFSDVVLQSWCIIECHFNDVILMCYEISSQDPKSDPLIDLWEKEKLAS